MSAVQVIPYDGRSCDAVYNLILPIQQDEFGIQITREQQPDLADIKSYYQDGIGNFWIAAVGAHVVGTIALKNIGNQQVALRKMFVHADYRGNPHKIAYSLLVQAMQWCQQKQIQDVFLGTTDKFIAAHRFYEKNGFASINKADLPPAFPVMQVDSKFYHLNVDNIPVGMCNDTAA